jgi:hypothetical protein
MFEIDNLVSPGFRKRDMTLPVYIWSTKKFIRVRVPKESMTPPEWHLRDEQSHLYQPDDREFTTDMMVKLVRRPWYGNTFLSSRSWSGMRRFGGMDSVRWMEIGTEPEVLMIEVGNEVTGELVASKANEDGACDTPPEDEVRCMLISSLSLS